jgi:hypothetical protein
MIPTFATVLSAIAFAVAVGLRPGLILNWSEVEILVGGVT